MSRIHRIRTAVAGIAVLAIPAAALSAGPAVSAGTESTYVVVYHAGANSNLLSDETAIDPLSGNAVLNGIPVAVEPVATA